LVFLHGLGATSRYWTCSRPRRPDAAYIDLFGFGGSPRPLVRYTLDRHLAMLRTVLSGQRVYVLVGHSLGAALALAYAARHPDDVDGLVLLGLPHDGSRRAAVRWLRQHPSGWITTNLAATAVACVATRRVLGPLLPQLLPNNPREIAEDLVAHNVLSSTTSLWDVLYGHDLAVDAAALPDHIVVHAVHGNQDTTAPITAVRTLAAARGWQFTELDGIGHHPWLDGPAACDRALADLATVNGRTDPRSSGRPTGDRPEGSPWPAGRHPPPAHDRELRTSLPLRGRPR
jgi:pimeloyl-ACP methyl ester carboxylesterase